MKHSALLHTLLLLLLHASYINAGTMDRLAESGREHPGKSAVYVLEKGEESLLTRAWLTQTAAQAIDVQYFIWSTDNIGTLASESLLSAAERGVRVRVIVDDLLIDAEPETLLSLNAHPNIQIKIYNPLHSVGRGFLSQLWHLITDFRGSNQRMHDKVVIYDQTLAITGGRNMADEYYDYDHAYNFRDRDVMVAGAVLPEIQQSFDAFWQSPLSVPLDNLLADEKQRLTQDQVHRFTDWLHQYAQNPENFAPEVRDAITDMGRRFDNIITMMRWTSVEYLRDIPGKNSSTDGLDGGGQTTTSLINLLLEAQHQILIESPYLIMPEGGFEFFSALVAKGIDIAIVTNSLASTDNLQAYSGYEKQKQRLLDLGIKIFEFKPRPGIYRHLIDRHESLGKEVPIFALHAKSLVIDDQVTYIGTFNFDPRSANLNTEVGLVIRDERIAQQVAQAIHQDMAPENSWQASVSDQHQEVGLSKKLKVNLWGLLPLEPIL
ncbi:MAG: phospholipase D family protein [gamma proteobacterium symbiont of Ctena orbiculata]|nr:MAG: phospholipase D family protein [gamma proteobacterium symbiont of Ctena orbiculata]PVV21029.1 MAG: phospholipase D family protein [gamma proteobacterium symbiont of Ctena orbiculata]PVV24555.1 MAG: phospholipase D family protein [gamma proteobacterium symbiont of Ctena orbiculata]